MNVSHCADDLSKYFEQFDFGKEFFTLRKRPVCLFLEKLLAKKLPESFPATKLHHEKYFVLLLEFDYFVELHYVGVLDSSESL